MVQKEIDPRIAFPVLVLMLGLAVACFVWQFRRPGSSASVAVAETASRAGAPAGRRPAPIRNGGPADAEIQRYRRAPIPTGIDAYSRPAVPTGIARYSRPPGESAGQ